MMSAGLWCVLYTVVPVECGSIRLTMPPMRLDISKIIPFSLTGHLNPGGPKLTCLDQANRCCLHNDCRAQYHCSIFPELSV